MPPVCHVHLHLLVAITEGQTGETRKFSKRQNLWELGDHWIEKYIPFLRGLIRVAFVSSQRLLIFISILLLPDRIRDEEWKLSNERYSSKRR
jgi:hypothetical protein